MAGHVLYTTPPCFVCGRRDTVCLDPEQLSSWQRGTLIQEAFPGASLERRELIKLGTHPECWNKMFPPEDPCDEQEVHAAHEGCLGVSHPA